MLDLILIQKNDDALISAPGEDGAISNLFDKSITGHIDLRSVMVSASEAGQVKKLDPDVLYKLWNIDRANAARTLEVTSQHCLQKDNPKSDCCNYGTND